MAGVTLNWGGRAPQAPRITDSEWEKYKALICELRPAMTLDALIEAMTEREGFRATRHQYKLRFQKWHLPSLEAFAALQEGSSRSGTNYQHTSADDDLVETSNHETALQNPTEEEELFQEVLPTITVERSFHFSLDRRGSISSWHESLHGSSAPSFFASDSDVEADSIPSSALVMSPVSKEDMLTRTTAEPLSTDATDIRRSTPLPGRNQVSHKRASVNLDKTLRPLFEWCASMLFQPDLSLKDDVSEKLFVAANQRWNCLCVRRALSSLFSDYFWKFCHGGGSKTCVLEWVEEISNKMQMHCFDLFATIALALMSLADLESWLHRCKQRKVDQLYSLFWELVDQVHDAAMALISEETELLDFLQPFWTAHSTVNFMREILEKSLEPLEKSLERLTALSRSEPYDFAKLLRPVSNDPPFNPTPRSSISSGLRSMLSLRQRIASRKAPSSKSNDGFSDSMSISYRDSCSLRHQLGLSSNSINTFSSVDKESARGIAMDWEPAVSDIQIGVAV